MKNLLVVMVLAVASPAWGQTGSGSVIASNPNLTSPAEVIPALVDVYPATERTYSCPEGYSLAQWQRGGDEAVIGDGDIGGMYLYTHGHYEKMGVDEVSDIERLAAPKCVKNEPVVKYAVPQTQHPGALTMATGELSVGTAPTAGSAMTLMYPTETGSLEMESATGEHVVLKARGPELLMAWDKDKNLILTVYRDGHVVTVGEKQLDTVSAMFWQKWVEFYKQETGKCFSDDQGKPQSHEYDKAK